MKHVLILLTDQQRKDTIGAYGDPLVQTPHLDALAKDSVVFDRCFTSSPVCVPARFSLFSGQYCNRSGSNNNNADHVYDGEGFYSRFTQAGYRSCCIGKMHHVIDPYGLMGFTKRISQEELTHPDDDYSKFIRENYPHVYDYHGMRSEMYYMPQISPLPAADHPTQWIGDHAVNYIDQLDPEEPMFLMASFIHPHPPFAVPAPWQKLFRDDPTPPYMPAQEDLETFRGMLSGTTCERLQISPQDMLRQKNFYHACVSFVDYQVGRIIDALKRKGIYDDTMIVFTSDHGDMMGDFGAVGKRTMMDAACNIPLIIHDPRQGSNRRYDACSIVDLVPTLLSYGEIPYDAAQFDGIDLFATAHPNTDSLDNASIKISQDSINELPSKPRYVFSQYGCGPTGCYMVTDGTHKLVYQAANDTYYYFDSLPEVRNTYSMADPNAMEMKAILDAHRATDVNVTPGAVRSIIPKKKHPHYPVRVDQPYTKALEAAEIPEEYHIDLE